MIDPRFYEVAGPLKAAEIAALAGGALVRGDPEREFSSIASAGQADKSDLTFLEEPGTDVSRAAVVVAAPEAVASIGAGPPIIESKFPRSGFGKAALRLIRLRELESGQPAIHPSARISPSAVLEPGVVMGAGVAIGPEARIGANAVIGPGVQIGARCRIGARVSLRCALIGDGVNIFSGAVIGESGFGLAPESGFAKLTPHFGRVIIQNAVSVGANTCIDRGLLIDTVIGEGTQIDNLCHIGHNVRIGSHAVLAGFAAVAGSTVIGDGVQFGGRVEVKDHLTVGPGAALAAGAAVLNDVPDGETWAGYPAKPIRNWMREVAWLARAVKKGKTE